jgi:hypothetical protein
MQYSKVIAASAAAVFFLSASATAQETVSFASSSNRESRRGEMSGSQAGLWLDRGDISAGDSRRDLIVGAPAWTSNTGRVYVVFAGPVFPGLEVSLAFADTILTGAAPGDRFGETTAAGYVTAKEQTLPLPNRDLVVGAPGVNGNSGAVYLFQRGFTNGQRLTTSDAILTITGAPAGAKLGAALATGDLDGDGYREIIIGAPGIGAVYVVHGGPGATGTINLAVPSASFFKIQGSAADGVGQVLAAGDLLGHAIPGTNTIYDLAIGAFNENTGAGAVYVIYGRGAAYPATMNLTTDADARLGGIDAGDLAGKTIQIGYFDKDRFADLLIGAPKAGGPGNARAQAGEMYIVWGAAALTSRSLSAADVTIYGAHAGDQEGTSLSFGDINRDGFSDIVSLAPGASTAGDLHAFYDRSRAAWGATFDLLTTAPDRRLIGDPVAGPIVSTVVYDLTGEGFDDIGVGIPSNGEGLIEVSYSIGAGVASGPFSRTVNPGSLVTLLTTGSGSPAPSLQWQVSADSGATWTNIPGATFPSYAFVAQASDTGKRFRSVFTNSLATAASNPAILTVRAIAQPARRADLDGDGLSDVVVWRPGSGTWFSLTSGSSFAGGLSNQWGNAGLGDKPFMGDIDGDGIVDLIVWRPGDGTWYWLTSSTGYNYANGGSRQWGNQSLGDVPMLGDMDGDGRADLVIWRASTGTWYWLTSSSGYSYASAAGIQWGNPSLGDQPLLGDFDGDGRQDLAVWRASTGTWYWLTSSSGYSYSSAHGIQWGNQGLGDVTLTGDIDGDGKTDLIIWRASTGTWYWLTSTTNYSYAGQAGKQWGNSNLGDVPLLGDFDGDGRADLTIWRASTGTWYWLTSSSGYSYSSARGIQWGASTDIPMVR